MRDLKLAENCSQGGSGKAADADFAIARERRLVIISGAKILRASWGVYRSYKKCCKGVPNGTLRLIYCFGCLIHIYAWLSGYIIFRAVREQDNTIFPYLYCLAFVNSWKFLCCLGLFSQYEKYYRLVLKFLFILELRRHATLSKSLIKKSLKPK